jgi:hypothetical protein
MIGSLSQLVRGAAILAIGDGTEQITRSLLDLPALPGKAPALPPGAFEVGYTAQDGAQHRIPLAEAAVVRFADT